MPPCRCTDTCACIVQGINGITVTGAGSIGNPYIVDGGGGGGGSGLRPARVVLGLAGIHTADEVDFLATPGSAQTAIRNAFIAAQPVDPDTSLGSVLMLDANYVCDGFIDLDLMAGTIIGESNVVITGSLPGAALMHYGAVLLRNVNVENTNITGVGALGGSSPGGGFSGLTLENSRVRGQVTAIDCGEGGGCVNNIGGYDGSIGVGLGRIEGNILRCSIYTSFGGKFTPLNFGSSVGRACLFGRIEGFSGGILGDPFRIYLGDGADIEFGTDSDAVGLFTSTGGQVVHLYQSHDSSILVSPGGTLFAGGGSSYIVESEGTITVNQDSAEAPAWAATFFATLKNAKVATVWGLGKWIGPIDGGYLSEGIADTKFSAAGTARTAPLLTVGVADAFSLPGVIARCNFNDSNTGDSTVVLASDADKALVRDCTFTRATAPHDIEVESGCTGAILRQNLNQQRASGQVDVLDNGTGTIGATAY